MKYEVLEQEPWKVEEGGQDLRERTKIYALRAIEPARRNQPAHPHPHNHIQKNKNKSQIPTVHTSSLILHHSSSILQTINDSPSPISNFQNEPTTKSM